LPIPTEQESSTLEAVNHPVSFTPYINFQNVLNQLEEKNIGSNEAEDNIADNLDILLEEERNFFMDSSLATIHSTLQSIHDQCAYLAKGELWKPRPNFKTPTKSIKLLNHHIKAGPTLTDIQTIRGVIKKVFWWPNNRLSHFPIKFPTFQLLPQIILLTNQLYQSLTTANEPIASLSAIGAVDELISTIKQIAGTGEFRKISKTFQEKLETKGAALNKKSRGILSLYQLIHDLQSILSCDHHSTTREFFTRFHQLTSQIDIDHYSILPPKLGARLLRLQVLIILHQ
jgi:hypothetical protein